MTGRRRTLAILVAAMVALFVLVAGVVRLIGHLIVNSESFGFVAAQVKASPEVRARVGEVLRVEPASFGPYRYSGQNDRAEIELQVVASGERCTVEVWVEASTPAKNEWAMTHLQIVAEDSACPPPAGEQPRDGEAKKGSTW